MLEITRVDITSTGVLSVKYRLNGINHARFFKNWELLDEFKSRYIVSI